MLRLVTAAMAEHGDKERAQRAMGLEFEMGTFSLWHWLVVGLVVLLLFGGGRISSAMGDVAKGIKAFRKGIADDDAAAPAQPAGAPAQPASITAQPAAQQQAPRS